MRALKLGRFAVWGGAMRASRTEERTKQSRPRPMSFGQEPFNRGI